MDPPPDYRPLASSSDDRDSDEGIARQNLGWLLDVARSGGDLRIVTARRRGGGETVRVVVARPRDFNYANDVARDALVASRPSWMPLAILVAESPEVIDATWIVPDPDAGD